MRIPFDDAIYPLANALTSGQITGVVIGVLIFIILVVTCVITCICCLTPTCPCHYNSITHRKTVSSQLAPQQLTANTTITSAKTTNYQPPPVVDPDTGY